MLSQIASTARSRSATDWARISSTGVRGMGTVCADDSQEATGSRAAARWTRFDSLPLAL
jgi:hypothetical protein